jgi:hypothetical protein
MTLITVYSDKRSCERGLIRLGIGHRGFVGKLKRADVEG